MRKQRKRERPRVKTRSEGVWYRVAKRGRRYEFAVYVNGKTKWFGGFDTERAAKTARAKKLAELGRNSAVFPSNEFFEDYWSRWLSEQSLGERTLDSYQRTFRIHLKPVFGRTRMRHLNRERMRQFIRGLELKGYRPWTIKTFLVPLSSVLTAAAEAGDISENPLSALGTRARPKVERAPKRILGRQELADLLLHAHCPYKEVIAVAAFAGLRQGEILGLMWQDLDFGEAVIRVRSQLSRTTNTRTTLKTSAAEREVAMSDALAAVLLDHKAQSLYDDDGDFVFTTKTGQPLSWSNVVKRGLHRAFKDAQLAYPRPRFHDLRHTYASLMIAQGADVAYLARQMGHKDPSVTLDVYTDLFEAREHRERHRKLLDEALVPISLVNGWSTTERHEPKSTEAGTAQ